VFGRAGHPVMLYDADAAMLEQELTVDGPNQLWVADLTYVAIAVGFVYLAVILTLGRAA
jgi:transposase InsO family protein